MCNGLLLGPPRRRPRGLGRGDSRSPIASPRRSSRIRARLCDRPRRRHARRAAEGSQPRHVARELVVLGSGPVVAHSAAVTALCEQIRAPLWPPVPTAPPIAQPVRRSPDQSTLVPEPVAISNGGAVITATASTLRARPFFRLAVLWDLVLRPARSQRRLALWVPGVIRQRRRPGAVTNGTQLLRPAGDRPAS
jgi:hypothetical protein